MGFSVNGAICLIDEMILGTEACPFCRRVREALTELDLSVEVIQLHPKLIVMIKSCPINTGIIFSAQMACNHFLGYLRSPNRLLSS